MKRERYVKVDMASYVEMKVAEREMQKMKESATRADLTLVFLPSPTSSFLLTAEDRPFSSRVRG